MKYIFKVFIIFYKEIGLLFLYIYFFAFHYYVYFYAFMIVF